ncbi:MAG: hypothetical protein HYZ07_02280 [Candidatus Harrisonbacteria bacterium]|nr:hypothetical protein [Candidatus Harrisonbacteria bacterium]MBI2406160.1 hypothetical protein [Candidatus Harrisonbacteria bacterium]MBI3114764.1 hypothetical protein [Candidatus Harrisonbacteria bacterium]
MRFPRDRDIGERAGVSAYRSPGDEWPRYGEALKQARGYLEKKSEKK